MQWKGRRLSFIATCLVVSIGWAIAYLSTNITTVLVSESFHGLGTNSLLAISQLSISEMVAPKYRNVSLQMFGTFQALGSVLTGVMARYLHWKTVGLVMCLPIVIAMFIGCAWPESPAWLASKGEFDKCEYAFSWLRGTDDDSRKELREIIATQQKNLFEMKNSKSLSLRKIWGTVTSRDFYVPSLHMFIVLNLMYWSGNMVIIIYCIDIISKTTTNGIASFASIIINAILIVGFAVGCIFLRLYKSKTVLLTSTFCASIFLSAACLVNYLQGTGVISNDSLWFLYCLMAFMLASSLGQIPIVFGISAELMPVKHRGIGGALFVIFTCVLHSSSLKAAPYLFLYLDIWGTFLIYVMNAILCGLIIWKYVPETKHRTLQDIEHYYKTGRFITRENSDAESQLIGHC